MSVNEANTELCGVTWKIAENCQGATWTIDEGCAITFRFFAKC